MADRRFETSFKQLPGSDEPGLVLGDDNVVYLIKPDGMRVAVASGVGFPPDAWTVDEFGNLKIASTGVNDNGFGSTTLSGICIRSFGDPDVVGDVFWIEDENGNGVLGIDPHGNILTGQLLCTAGGEAYALEADGSFATDIARFVSVGQYALRITSALAVIMPNLPTTDPAVLGQLWVDPAADHVVKQSQG